MARLQVPRYLQLMYPAFYQAPWVDIRVKQEGDKWWALLGPNGQTGYNGYGNTIPEAVQALVDELKEAEKKEQQDANRT